MVALFSAVNTFNLKGAQLVVLESEHLDKSGDFAKFKRALDRRTGKTYVLQYTNINGKFFVCFII